jgi:tyrosine-protein kinase Etk/Wzc
MTLFIVCAGMLDRTMLLVIEKYCTDQKYKNMGFLHNDSDGGSGRYGYMYSYKYGYRYGYKYGYHYGYNGYAEEEEAQTMYVYL